MIEKYKLQQEDRNSMDLNGETLAKLKQILPEVFAEGADGKPSIDVEKLKIALGGAVDVESDNKSRFSFGWSGKKQAQSLANQPSTATLRPSIDDSKNWDNTQNVYIEGDNLEVLKLLQKSYYGQVKMIYIDPPYNTGKDFVYKDNFHDNVKNYLQLTGQVDDEGNRISTNTDKSGRYHTDWLNMMYPRLKLARNLLKDNGVIFISIDDNEVHNLRKICDEVFGEDNFIAQLVWKKKYTGGKHARFYADLHEYILVYSKSINDIEDFCVSRTNDELMKFIDVDEFVSSRGKYYVRPLKSNLEERKTLIYPVIFPDGSQIETQWLIGKERFDIELSEKRIEFRQKRNGEWQVYKKYYENDGGGMVKPFSLIEKYFNTEAKVEMKNLFNITEGRDNLFYTVKPTNLIKFLISYIAQQADIILDFFSGSATTAHAVMQLNAEDGGNRKYICVQLPETTATDSEAYKAGYKNICEIGKERIRRAGEKVLTEWTEKQQKSAQTSADAGLFAEDTEKDTAQTSLDIGFKVFKLDTSNIKPFDANDMFADDLLVDGRSALDLFYELVLKQGYSLDNRQSILDIGGTRCYALVHEDNTPFVLAVLDDTVKPNFALEILKYTLTLVIVKDDCFGTDEIKLNLLATLEQLQNKDNPLQIRIV